MKNALVSIAHGNFSAKKPTPCMSAFKKATL
jgi:hypothetical protein